MSPILDVSHPERFWSKLVAFWNIPCMVYTLDVSHPEMSPLKSAPRNIDAMLVTLETSHADMSPLKSASRNIYDMLVTLETSHPETSPVKSASRNIYDMSVTLGVFHPEMSTSCWLKASANIYDISVTLEASHPDMFMFTGADNLKAFWNIDDMSVTPDRSGVSGAATCTMRSAPLNADSMDVHDMLPHCTMWVSLSALLEVPSASRIRVRSPDMDTL